MKVFAGLAVLLGVVAAALGAPQKTLAEPPTCPPPIPGVALNITFYPNEDDCNKYWECDNGNLYNGTCDEGLVWNPTIDSCDWPFNYDCPYAKLGNSLMPSAAIDCPVPPPGGFYNITFYPDETDCTKYWECDNGNLYNGTCPGDTIWNPNIDSCDWTYNYDCPYDKVKRSPVPNAAIDCPVPPPGGFYNITFYPDETDCTKYWECDNGNLYNGTCPGDTIWNPNIDSCDWPSHYDCPYDKMGTSQQVIDCPKPSDEPMDVIYYPNEEDCTKYWACDNGKLLNETCTGGLIWNPIFNTCDWPYNYDCPYD